MSSLHFITFWTGTLLCAVKLLPWLHFTAGDVAAETASVADVWKRDVVDVADTTTSHRCEDVGAGRRTLTSCR